MALLQFGAADKLQLKAAECVAGFHFFNTREEAKNDKY